MKGKKGGRSRTTTTDEQEHKRQRVASEDPAASAAPAALVPFPVPPPAVDLVSTLSESVVTVVGVGAGGVDVSFGTGFVLLNKPKHTVIFASVLLHNSLSSKNVRSTSKTAGIHRFGVYFSGQNSTRMPAYLLGTKPESRFMILVVEDAVQRRAVSPCTADAPARQEVIRTLSAMAYGSMVHPGVIGCNKGVVITPSCRARLANGGVDKGTDKYMVIRCNFQDVIVLLQTIDTKYRRSNVLLAAPVFRKTGELIGVIQCAGQWMDVKIGLHARFLHKEICLLLKITFSKQHSWEVLLQNVGSRVDIFTRRKPGPK